MSDEVRDAPGPDAPRDDWRDVVDALSALGESIGRATRSAVDDDENRRRLRELRDGLEALARRLGESVERAAASPEGRRVTAAVDAAAASVAVAGERFADEVRPEVVNAFRQASAKFKEAADAYDRPVSAPTFPGAPFAPAPVAAVAIAPATAASVPVPSAALVATPAAPLVAEAPAQLAPNLLEAVRVTNDRFQAERKAAVEAAAALAAESSFLPPEPEPATEPAIDLPPEPEAPAPDDAAPSSVDEALDSPIADVAAEAPSVSFDPWGEALSDPATGQPNAPAPDQPGLFDFTDEGEDEIRPPRGADFDFREVDEGSAGSRGGYTP